MNLIELNVTVMVITFAIWLAICVEASNSQDCPAHYLNITFGCQIKFNCTADYSIANQSVKLLFDNNAEIACCQTSYVEFTGTIKFNLAHVSMPDPAALFHSMHETCWSKLVAGRLDFYLLQGFNLKFKGQLFYLSSRWFLVLSFRYSWLRLVDDEQGHLLKCENASDLGLFEASSAIDVSFEYGNKYEPDTCVEIFRNSRISSLSVLGVVNSLIAVNQFGIKPSSNTKELNSQVRHYSTSGYALTISASFFHSPVFKTTTFLYFTGSVGRVEEAFLVGSRLEKILLKISSLKKFWHNNFKWLDMANNRSTEAMLTIEMLLLPDVLSLNDYENPNQYNLPFINPFSYQKLQLYEVDPSGLILDENSNFCIFYRLRQRDLNVKLAGQLISKVGHTKCDCLLYWLRENYLKEPEDSDDFDKMQECARREQELRETCDFEKMAQRCQIENVQPIEKEATYTFVFRLKYAEFVLGILLSPLVNLLGIVLNFFVIRTFRCIERSPEIRRKKLTDKNRLMWKYLYINSYFVLIQAVINALGPLTACIEYTGVYCSPLILTRFMQVFYLFVENYIGNLCKLTANVTCTMFVLYRFAVNVDCWPKLRKYSPKRLVVYFLLVSAVLSSCRLWVNDRFNLYALWQDPFDYLVRVVERSQNYSMAIRVIYLFNMLLGNVFFVLVNLVTDLRLLMFMRSLNQENRKEKAESRITKMIVISGLFSFLFRMPEIVVSIAFLISTINPTLFQSCILSQDPVHAACPSLFQIGRFFYSFSFLENFILLYLFNSDFKKQFIESFDAKSRK
nr:G protein-coupled receptor [Proales similis]